MPSVPPFLLGVLSLEHRVSTSEGSQMLEGQRCTAESSFLGFQSMWDWSKSQVSTDCRKAAWDNQTFVGEHMSNTASALH